jgi:rhodanese-related sulfurtransferase
MMGSVLLWSPQHAHSQEALSATTIPDAQQIQPADLVPLLAEKDAAKAPVVIQVGSQVFFRQAHIAGSVYAGPGSQAAGLALLEKTVAPLAKDKFIVLYCGCCPWNRCPNVGPAYKRLQELGYTNVKVVYFAHNFGDDWVSKGYPTQK